MKKGDFIKGFSVIERREDVVTGTVMEVLEYSIRDFYGPSIQVLVTKVKGELPKLKPNKDTYGYEDVDVCIGVERTIKEMAKEYYNQYGCHILTSRFGEILIDSENIDDIFEEFKKTICIF